MPSRRSLDAATPQHTAALFVDYDNLRTILSAQSARGKAPGRYATEILDEVQRYLEEGDDTPTVLGRAYADFASLPDAGSIQRFLHRRSVEPVFTPNEAQKNASELRLTLEVSRLLAERPDLETFVIVTGDRPYLPLVRHIREQGRRPLVAAVNPPQSDALSQSAEDDAFLDARNLLSQSSRDDLLANAPSGNGSKARSGSRDTPPPRRYRSLDNPVARQTVEITEEHFGQYDEVYLTPLLRKLSDILGEEHDPKSLVSELEAAGAVRLEKRDGYPYDYTVLIVNDDHPDVADIQRRRSRSDRSEASANGVGGGLDESHGHDEDDAADRDIADDGRARDEASAERRAGAGEDAVDDDDDLDDEWSSWSGDLDD